MFVLCTFIVCLKCWCAFWYNFTIVCNGATLTDGYMSWVCGVKLKNRTKTLGIKAVTAVQKCSTLRWYGHILPQVDNKCITKRRISAKRGGGGSYNYRVFQKKSSPLKLFEMFSLRLSLYAWNFANLLVMHIHVYLPIFKINFYEYFVNIFVLIMDYHVGLPPRALHF